MNLYDQYFTFRIAVVEDVENIMHFIKENWKENHILSYDKELFMWQYGNTEYGDTKNINFILMEDRQKNIVGINGFISYAAEPKKRAVSCAITKVRQDLSIPMCGVEMLKRFMQLVPAKDYYDSGTNPKTLIPIFERMFNRTVGTMQQWYCLNREVDDFRIAKIVNRKYRDSIPSDLQLKIVSFSDIEQNFDFEASYKGQGYKSPNYIRKRYFEHPIYKYFVWAIIKPNEKHYKGFLVGRVNALFGHEVLRIVDYVGDVNYLKLIGSQVKDIVIKNAYEYVDFVASDLPEETLEQAGFILRTESDVNIIPHYFEPFIQENITIWYQKSNERIIIFKADGDQDRPNYRP